MTTVTIRTATAADGPAVLRIDRLTHDTASSPGPGPAADADPWERQDPEDALLAEVDGDVVGYLLLGRSTSLDSNAHVLMVKGLAVDPDASGRGVGRALLRAGVDEAVRRRARRLTLRVLGHNDVARRLYESEGFEVEGVLRGEFVLDGCEVDDVLMARRLG